jgi:lysyl-tRNA synthetase class 2
MSSSNSLRFLRPYLYKELPAARKSAYLRFFSSTRCRFDGADSRKISDELKAEGIPDWNRAQRLESAELLKWPRLERNASALSTKEFNSRYKTLSPSESAKDSVTVRGITPNSFQSVHVLMSMQEGLSKSDCWERDWYSLILLKMATLFRAW